MRRVRGFTLIELLFVVAIIGVLLAIATPVFRRVRKEAMRSACRGHLRQIGMAAHEHATDHKLHVPVAGPMVGTGEEGMGWECTPEGMGDPDRTRHVYFDDDRDGTVRPVGIQAALASYLGHTVRMDSYAHLEEDQQKKTGLYDNFLCPAQPEEPGLSMTVRQDNNAPWEEEVQGKWMGPEGYTQYAWNDSLSGRRPRMARVAGNIARLTRPERTLFMADCVPWSQPFYHSSPTLWHWLCPNPPSSLGAVHDWKLNVAFVDGHAASLRIGQEGDEIPDGDLFQAYLAHGVQGGEGDWMWD